MPEIPNLTRKPLVKKDEEMDITPKSTFKEDPVVEEVSVVETPVVKMAIAPSGPRQFMCKTKCWVSSKCQMYEPGDVVIFESGEFVPEHFE